jgi:hypothetical protein
MAAGSSTSSASAVADGRSPGPSPRWGLVLGAGWVALVALHLWIARGVTGPIVLQDETGYLGNARWLARLTPVPEMGEEPVYAWGYSLLVAPLVRLIDDPALLHRSVQVLNSLLLASLLPLLWLVLRRVGGLDRTTAAGAAAVGSVFPATLVHSSVGWAESLLPVLSVLLVLATWAALTERPLWQRVWPAPVALAAYASHPRYLAALVLTTAAVVVAGATRRLPGAAALVGVAVGVGGFVAVRAVDAALVAARWPDRVPDEGSLSRLVGRLLSPSNWPELVGSSVGQAWYLAVGGLGLAVAGALACVVWCARGTEVDEPRRLTVVFLGLVLLGLFVTSAVSFVGTAERVDHLIYGRYNEAWVPLLVAAGVAALLRLDPSPRTRLLGAAAAVTAVLGTALTVGRGLDAFTGEIVWNNVLALRLVHDVVGQRATVPVATVVAVVAVGVLVAAGWSHTMRWIAAAASGLALVVTAAIAVGPLADFSRVRYDGWELPDQLARVLEAAGVDAVALDRDDTGLMAVLGYPFWSPDVTFRFLDRWDLPDDPALVVSSVDGAGLPEGALLVALDARNAQGVWALPGAVGFERLLARGAVLPPGFPVPLDAAARQAAIALLGGSPGLIDMERGGSVELDVSVAHTGTGEAWPSDVEWPMPGVVRVGMRWFDADGRLVQAGAWSPLPSPFWPGDTAEVDLELRAVDDAGAPLPAGRYTVEVGLFQAEVGGWFVDDGGTGVLRLDVTVR